MSEHTAGCDFACICWTTRPCGCYMWDRDCPGYTPEEEQA